MLQQQKKNKGFTIIEVLIVLAIAGLIMLVVFLAVPALQRNSRNNARSADASTILTAVNQCLSNRNSLIASCDTVGELVTNGGLTAASLNQITGVNGTDLTNSTTGSNTTNVGNGLFNQLNYAFDAECNADGSSIQDSSNTRSYAATIRIENGTANGLVKCVSS